MGSNPDWDKIRFNLKVAERYARDAEKRACTWEMKDWNTRVQLTEDTEPSPSIGVAVIGGHPWLQVFCPGCKIVSEVDVRTLDRHPATKLSALIPSLSCRRCRGGSPFAKIRGASAGKMTVDYVSKRDRL